MSTILVRCFSCDSKLKVKLDHVGKVCKCPACGIYIIIPKEDGMAIEPTPDMLKKLRELAEAKKSAGGIGSQNRGSAKTEWRFAPAGRCAGRCRNGSGDS